LILLSNECLENRNRESYQHIILANFHLPEFCVTAVMDKIQPATKKTLEVEDRPMSKHTLPAFAQNSPPYFDIIAMQGRIHHRPKIFSSVSPR
jgi:hypothetical protein